MSFSPRLSAIIAGTATVAALVQLQPALAQKTAAEIREIAEAITVRIDGPGAGGSGFIVELEGNTYTVLTNWHVVDREGDYTVKTADGRQHRVAYGQIQELPGADLAILSFTSSQRYRVAELGNSDRVTSPQTVYVSGWINPLPAIPEPSYSFIDGKITSVLPQPNDRGYSLVYNTSGNYKGMSGGPALDEEGRVVGINGEAAADLLDGPVGLYLGIPINAFEGVRVRETVIETAEEAWKRGKARSDQEDYERAIEYFNQATRLSPDYADAYNSRGWAYHLQGKHERAIADFDQAIRLNADYVDAYNNRGWVYYRQGKHERAIADFDRAIRLNPDRARAYFHRGWVYYSQTKYERAIADCNSAIIVNPNYAIAYNCRGVAYAAQKNYERALADYSESLRLNVFEPWIVQTNRGIAYGLQGNYERAIEDYNQAIRLNPNYAIAYVNRGDAHYYQKNYEGAIEDYSQAIRINPDYATAYNNRGNAYREQARYERAIEDYNQAIRISPDYAEAYYSRGFALRNIGERQRAIEDFRKAAALHQAQGNARWHEESKKRIEELSE
ncbi:MAG: tetratricopeptide repeat protein [Oscillatoria sp. SIO1A7]|nr:tetratricopeptide repeat protein [Oscillatoria sp. SIO1A7]